MSFEFSEKKFSFLSADEIAKMKEEEERRIASMTKVEIEKLAVAAEEAANQEVDKALDDVEQIEGVLRRPSQQELPTAANAQQPIHTAKGERLARERRERELGEEAPEDLDYDGDDAMSPAEKRALDAERRAAWRKARLKSLENVRSVGNSNRE